jgi:hypothetical protein
VGLQLLPLNEIERTHTIATRKKGRVYCQLPTNDETLASLYKKFPQMFLE